MNKKINLNLVLVLAVASVIAIPIVYGAIEPSIIINMDAGQTTKPLQIKDNLGTEVFSVDTDGTIFPSGFGNIPLNSGTTSNTYELSFEQVAETTQIFNASGIDNFLQLARWKIDFNGEPNEKFPTNHPRVALPYGFLSGHLKSSDVRVDMDVLVTYSDNSQDESIVAISGSGLLYDSDSNSRGSSSVICVSRSSATGSCFLTLA